jgi:hypothetical protein
MSHVPAGKKKIKNSQDSSTGPFSPLKNERFSVEQTRRHLKLHQLALSGKVN